MQTRRQPSPFGFDLARAAGAVLAAVFPTPADRSYAAFTPAADPPQDPDGALDERIRDRLLLLLDGQAWWNADTANVWVKDGVVIYQGLRNRLADRRAAFTIAEQVPGVCAVRDHRVVAREWQAMA